MAKRRSGTASTKTRGEIRGGGKKPWRQKGTGRARAGTNRSPIWTGGGTIFGPKPRSYAFSLPKKMRKAALRSVLTAKLKDNQLTVMDKIELDAPKTKLFVEILKTLGLEAKRPFSSPLKRTRPCCGRPGTFTRSSCSPQRGSTSMTCFVSTVWCCPRGCGPKNT